MHYIIESEIQWKPFWLATQQYPQNDWLSGNFPCTMMYVHGAHYSKIGSPRTHGRVTSSLNTKKNVPVPKNVDFFVVCELFAHYYLKYLWL